MGGRVMVLFTLVVANTENLPVRRNDHGTYRHVACSERL
jgi:hypothetical protein